jgi:hypothetical protein
MISLIYEGVGVSYERGSMSMRVSQEALKEALRFWLSVAVFKIQ